MNPLPSPPISPKNRVIKQPNQRTKLLPTIRKGRLTDRTQTAGQHRINKHHHHARPTISYLLHLHLLHQHRMVIKRANINQLEMLASVHQQQKLIQRKR